VCKNEGGGYDWVYTGGEIERGAIWEQNEGRRMKGRVTGGQGGSL